VQTVLFHASPATTERPGGAIIVPAGRVSENRPRGSAILHDDPKLMPPAATTLDPAALQRLHELDPSGTSRLVERVFKAFEDSIERLRPQLLTALARGDATGLRHVAHTLKSSSASIGAIKLSSLCAEMEAMTRDGQTDGMAERTHELCAEIDAVLAALKPDQPA
jgi:HPt (histidine-containing phosphotransfer) domain-containing protein